MGVVCTYVMMSPLQGNRVQPLKTYALKGYLMVWRNVHPILLNEKFKYKQEGPARPLSQPTLPLAYYTPVMFLSFWLYEALSLPRAFTHVRKKPRVTLKYGEKHSGVF